MRLDGAGRRLLRPDLDAELVDWIREKRENKQLVSRRIISNKATELFRGTDIKVGTDMAFIERTWLSPLSPHFRYPTAG